MVLNKERKTQIIEELTQILGGVKGSIFLSFSGLNAEKTAQIREEVKKKGGAIKVVKNNLLEIIFKKLNIELPENIFEGPTAIAYTFDDEIDLVKELYQFTKGNENLVIKGGIIENQFYGDEKIKTLALLPSKKELYSKLVYVLNSPKIRLISALKNPTTRLVYALKNYQDKIKA